MAIVICNRAKSLPNYFHLSPREFEKFIEVLKNTIYNRYKYYNMMQELKTVINFSLHSTPRMATNPVPTSPSASLQLSFILSFSPSLSLLLPLSPFFSYFFSLSLPYFLCLSLPYFLSLSLSLSFSSLLPLSLSYFLSLSLFILSVCPIQCRYFSSKWK